MSSTGSSRRSTSSSSTSSTSSSTSSVARDVVLVDQWSSDDTSDRAPSAPARATTGAAAATRTAPTPARRDLDLDLDADAAEFVHGVPLSHAATQERIQRYHEFVEKKLRADLHAVVQQRDDVYTELAHYLALQTNLRNLVDSKLTTLKTQVNIGCDVYMKARVPNPSRVFVDVGLGFHVEFELPEAIAFIDQKKEQLEARARLYSKRAATITSHIKMVYEGIASLMQLPAPNERAEREARLRARRQAGMSFG